MHDIMIYEIPYIKKDSSFLQMYYNTNYEEFYYSVTSKPNVLTKGWDRLVSDIFNNKIHGSFIINNKNISEASKVIIKAKLVAKINKERKRLLSLLSSINYKYIPEV